MTVLTNAEYRLLVLAVQENASAETKDKAFRLLNAKAELLRGAAPFTEPPPRAPYPEQADHTIHAYHSSLFQYRKGGEAYDVYYSRQYVGRVKGSGTAWAAAPMGKPWHRPFHSRYSAAVYLARITRGDAP